MKLAEALIQRKDTLVSISETTRRLTNMALLQEGDEPEYDKEELFRKMDNLYKKLELLIKRINKTNSNVKFDEERTIADALADRDILAYRRNYIEKLQDASQYRRNAYSRSEIKSVRTYDVKKLADAYNEYAKQYRELDTKIQQKNWETELME